MTADQTPILGDETGWVLPFRSESGSYGTIEATEWKKTNPGLIRIKIVDPDAPHLIAADVRNGRVERLEYGAKPGERITHQIIRSPNVVGFLERWSKVAEAQLHSFEVTEDGRTVAWPISASVDQSLKGLLEELEKAILSRRSEARPARLRGEKAEQLLRQVVDEYRNAIDAGDPQPRVTVGNRLGYSPAHIGRLLVKARKNDPKTGRPPLLGPARRGAAGEEPAAMPEETS